MSYTLLAGVDAASRRGPRTGGVGWPSRRVDVRRGGRHSRQLRAFPSPLWCRRSAAIATTFQNETLNYIDTLPHTYLDKERADHL